MDHGMPLLPLQRGIIYGPVSSRRLGASLGVNISPPGKKICTFNCLYCQYGWTTGSSVSEHSWPAPHLVLDALRSALSALRTPPDYITFSGNGEPTMHPQLGAIVEGVTEIRDRMAPGARTAILSNGSRATFEEVRNALKNLDVRIMKLDAGTDEVLTRYNSPAPGISLEGITAALRSLEGVTLQALFSGGPSGNFTPGHVTAWVARVREVGPRGVQIYTLDRPFPSARIAPLSRADLIRIRDVLRAPGIQAEVY